MRGTPISLESDCGGIGQLPGTEKDQRGHRFVFVESGEGKPRGKQLWSAVTDVPAGRGRWSLSDVKADFHVGSRPAQSHPWSYGSSEPSS